MGKFGTWRNTDLIVQDLFARAVHLHIPATCIIRPVFWRSGFTFSWLLVALTAPRRRKPLAFADKVLTLPGIIGWGIRCCDLQVLF